MPLTQGAGSELERNHGSKTPYERRGASVPTPRSVSHHQLPTPAATPSTPASTASLANASPSTEFGVVTPPVRQRKRTRTNELAEAGPSSSSSPGSTTPSNSRTRSGQPSSNGKSSSSLQPTPTKKARLQASKEVHQQATSSQQANSRANIGAGKSVLHKTNENSIAGLFTNLVGRVFCLFFLKSSCHQSDQMSFRFTSLSLDRFRNGYSIKLLRASCNV